MRTTLSLITPSDQRVAVSLFYRYAHLEQLEEIIAAINGICRRLQLLGRCLVSFEGVNGTMAGSPSALFAFESIMRFMDPSFVHMDIKYSYTNSLPFKTLSVRIVDELIAPGSRKGAIIKDHVKFDESYGGLDGTGFHLIPRDFHSQVLQLLNDDSQGLLLDIRNLFESDIGRFQGSKSLDTYYYSESWDAIDSRVNQFIDDHGTKPPKILMYCTGGIRCEKASAYLRAKGFDGIYQLQGGIHRYLDEFGDSSESLFKGKNYVFDSRMAVSNNSENHANKSSEIIGTCIDCHSPYDSYSIDRSCTVCRYPVLVCGTCFEMSTRKEFYCRRHYYLKDIYFSDLRGFTLSELIQQDSKLGELEATFRGQKFKSRRHMLQMQRLRVSEIIRSLDCISA